MLSISAWAVGVVAMVIFGALAEAPMTSWPRMRIVPNVAFASVMSWRPAGTSSMSKPWIGKIEHWTPLAMAQAEGFAVEEQ